MPTTTPVHFAIKQYLDDQYTRLERDKITHWLMRFSANLPTDIDDCRGGKIRRGPTKFEGQVRDIYWNFIRPCLEDIIHEAFTRANTIGREHQSKVARRGFDETAQLLRVFVTRIYTRMVEIDRALRGKGSPSSVAPYDPSRLIAVLHTNIDAQHASLKEHNPVGIRRWWAHAMEDPLATLTSLGVGSLVGGLILAALEHLLKI